MRWIWIDKFIEFTSRTSASAVKTCTLAEVHLHDLYPYFPILPHSLIVEGMAQTAGMLVGEAREFKEKVILAKVGRATFHRLVRPGESIVFKATVDQLNDHGASISGVVELHTLELSADGSVRPVEKGLVAEIELMFSHIDNNISGMKFPEDNFVFTETFVDLLINYRRGQALKI